MIDIIRDYVDLSWSNLKISFGLFRQGEFSQAIHVLSRTGHEVFYLIGFGFALSEMLNIIFRKDLKLSQKVLPILGIGLGGFFSLLAGLILFSSATAFLPFLVIASGVINFVQTLGRYYQNTAQYDNLKQQFCQPLDIPENLKTIIDKTHFSKTDVKQYFTNIPPENQKMNYLLKLIENKQQLHSLRKNIPRRFNTLILNTAVILSTVFAAMVIIPAKMWIYSLLSLGSIGLYIGAMINEIRITLKERASENKISHPKKKFLATVFPTSEKTPDLVWGYQKTKERQTLLDMA